MKKTIILSLFALTATLLAAQPRISILGDSYSTYKGYVQPDSNICWYGHEERKKVNDVRNVGQTWWRLLAAQGGYRIEVNNSYSGATICHTGYEGKDYSDRSFVSRHDHLGQPDIILVFGGTNDSWAGAPLGEYQYADWTKAQLYHFRPAFACLLASLAKRYPQAKVYNISNCDLNPAYTEAMAEICRHYGIIDIALHDIEKQNGHPDVAGMQEICRQVLDVLKKDANK